MRPHALLSCVTCDKFVPNNPDAPRNGGGCRAMPPTPIVLGVIEDKITHRVTPNLQTAWPGVGAKGDWCALHPYYEPPTKLMMGKPAGPTEEVQTSTDPNHDSGLQPA